MAPVTGEQWSQQQADVWGDKDPEVFGRVVERIRRQEPEVHRRVEEAIEKGAPTRWCGL